MYFNTDEDGKVTGRQEAKYKETQSEAMTNRKRKSMNTWLRGEQVNVAYKWDPAGLIKKDAGEKYLIQWLTQNTSSAGGPSPEIQNMMTQLDAIDESNTKVAGQINLHKTI